MTSLTVTRLPGEKIWIDREICFEIVRVNWNKVSVRVSAPRERVILREELLDDKPTGDGPEKVGT